jgi:hypothetical protein
MALFTKKKSKTQNLEPELTALRQRAEALDTKRQAAEIELTAATEARQQHLVQGDLADDKTAQALQDAVNVAASKVVGLEDAITLVQAQIADIERKIEMQRNAAEREAASDALARALDEMERTLPILLSAAQSYADAVDAVGFWHFESGQAGALVRNTKAQIEIAGAFSSQELRAMVGAIRDGRAPIPPKAPAEPARVAQIERPAMRTVFCLRSIKWRDSAGRQQAVMQYEDAVLPQALADLALRKGHCLSVTDERRKTLRNARGGHHPKVNALDIVDLDAIEEEKAPYLGPDAVLRAASFQQVDRGDARVIQIAAGRAG